MDESASRCPSPFSLRNRQVPRPQHTVPPGEAKLYAMALKHRGAFQVRGIDVIQVYNKQNRRQNPLLIDSGAARCTDEVSGNTITFSEGKRNTNNSKIDATWCCFSPQGRRRTGDRRSTRPGSSGIERWWRKPRHTWSSDDRLSNARTYGIHSKQ